MTDAPQQAAPLDHVDAGPTKAFFVSMITRDIELMPAIVDLIDNSVDGARSVRGREDLTGLTVRVDFGGDHFRISDNCGGIETEVARHYAFRFGRPEDAPGVAHSVGQFGVGMKRALFKIGNAFTVTSVAATSDFRLDVSVSEWARSRGGDSSQDDWGFTFSDYHDDVSHVEEDRGTTIEVSELHQGVAADFELSTFESGLVADIKSKHRLSLSRGLTIFVNGHGVQATEPSVVASDAIRPIRRHLELRGPRGGSVDVILIAGLSVVEDPPDAPGWYVFCNERLVLGPDTTADTVWGEGRGRTIPRFHTQFSRFRGYAFFDSDQPKDLPWTTTKVGVEGNSPVWRTARQEMVKCTRPVIDFLNLLHWEHPQIEAGDIGELETVAASATPQPALELPEQVNFIAPRREDIQPPPSTTSIQYRLSTDLVELAKDLLGVSTNGEVGRRTFDYYMDAEG